MKSIQHLIVIIAFSLFSSAVFAQEKEGMTAAQALNQEKIEKQFDVVIKKSGKFQEYKVVKRIWIDKLKRNTIDTIKTLESKLTAADLKIKEQQTTITGLEETLGNTNQSLSSITEEKDNMVFLGMSLTKGNYKIMMWGIVAGLLLLLAFFIFRFKNSNTITIQANKALAETEKEFEEHRTRALEREQKVMRKLQDEINKQRKTSTTK